MLEGLSDKQLSTVVEGEVPPQRGHERNRQGPVGEGLVGCGGWGRAWATFVKDLKGDKERRGFGGLLSAPDLEETARRRLPAKWGGHPEPGPEG